MPKPTESASPNRPLKPSSEGTEIKLTATIELAGHHSSDVRIGNQRVTLRNALLREAAGTDDL